MDKLSLLRRGFNIVASPSSAHRIIIQTMPTVVSEVEIIRIVDSADHVAGWQISCTRVFQLHLSSSAPLNPDFHITSYKLQNSYHFHPH